MGKVPGPHTGRQSPACHTPLVTKDSKLPSPNPATTSVPASELSKHPKQRSLQVAAASLGDS